VAILAAGILPAEAQGVPGAAPDTSRTESSSRPAGVVPPSGYVIGPEDVLTVLFWRDKDMSADAVVRPDGKITLPLLNEVQAAGLTPEQLRNTLTEQATRYLEDPSVTVVVKQINSLKVFVMGEVGKPGVYTMTAPLTVIQLLAMAGGVNEYAKKDKIVVMRTENGRQMMYPFNYEAVTKRSNMRQNITLKPGDTIIVP
jgi:polysaccharide export outer membrane protein